MPDNEEKNSGRNENGATPSDGDIGVSEDELEMSDDELDDITGGKKKKKKKKKDSYESPDVEPGSAEAEEKGIFFIPVVACINANTTANVNANLAANVNATFNANLSFNANVTYTTNVNNDP